MTTGMRFSIGFNVACLALNAYWHTWPGAFVSTVCIIFLLVVAP